MFAVAGWRISLNNQPSLNLPLHISKIVKESYPHKPQILLHLQLSLECHFGILLVLFSSFSASTLIVVVGIDAKHVNADEARRGRVPADQPRIECFSDNF